MSDALSRDPELVLITALCRQLAERGLSVGLSDAGPAAEVRTGPHPFWVTVDESGEFFEWSEAKSQHPATDPAGAAALICEYVGVRRSVSGEAS
jgi:hypothetical protein